MNEEKTKSEVLATKEQKVRKRRGGRREKRNEQVASEELIAAYEKVTGILIGVMVLALKVPDQVPLPT